MQLCAGMDVQLSPWNAAYLEELYEKRFERPQSLDDATRRYLEELRRERESSGASSGSVVGVVRLSEAIRRYGHRCARLDPLGRPPPGDRGLETRSHSLTEEDLERLPARLVGGPLGERASTAKEAVAGLRRIYCSTRGYDYGHIHAPEERSWLAEAAESGRFRPPLDPLDEVAVLERLAEVEAFEQFLNRMLPGKFRFSIEGLDMLVPLLEETLGVAAETGVRSMILGMAHRGRLNVMVHVLRKPYARVMSELRDPEVQAGRLGGEEGFRGDVTYHMGARRAARTDGSVDLTLTLLPNPSHLEAIDPLVVGMARAAGSSVDRRGAPVLAPGATLPVLVHGDASFPGQGVVAETLNLGRLPGYDTGGTIHVIANNGLGFTTDPEDLYSTQYASDLAKGFDVPVLHVNADDPEAVLEGARTAVAFLTRFRKDFVIDLVGYRRRGHNESDEPSFTQPLLYSRIESEPTVREKWARELVRRGAIEDQDAEALFESAMDRLRKAWNESKEESGAAERDELPRGEPRIEGLRAVSSTVDLERLRELNRALLELPEGFELHPKLRTARERRRGALEDPDAPAIDWGTAEELAFAAILGDGTGIRVTGEDVERGTFSQRHAVFHDVANGRIHVPLQSIGAARAAFEIENSPLSENAALGFEMGYNVAAPERLVIWEAQYGDFINAAQVVVDEFLVSARAKWGLDSSLVLFLPHGHEGHGPDHSSGRPERFLALAAERNLVVANVTTAAQYFHLLRRHAALLREDPLPLVLFTPKMLLRHPLSRSSPRELSEGAFRTILDDPSPEVDRGLTRRLLLMSGKVYVDLAESDLRRRRRDVALCRVEQLYPFPRPELVELLRSYPNLDEIVWVQEEPENMGAWSFVRPRIAELLPEEARFGCAAREASPSPAEGSFTRHQRRQDALVRTALSPEWESGIVSVSFVERRERRERSEEQEVRRP